MKKALNITSLVFGILGVLSVIAFLILGTVFLVSADPLARAIVDQAIQADSTVDAEALYESTLVVFSTCGTAFVVMGAIGIAGTALCFHIDDGGRDEPQNDERNEETKELAEESVEGDEETNRNVGRKKPEQNAQSDGDENAGQEANGGKFHGSLWRVMGKTCFPKRKIRVRREQVLTPGCALYL